MYKYLILIIFVLSFIVIKLSLTINNIKEMKEFQKIALYSENYNIESVLYKKMIDNQIYFIDKNKKLIKIKIKPEHLSQIKNIKNNSFLYLRYIKFKNDKCLVSIFNDSFKISDYSLTKCIRY